MRIGEYGPVLPPLVMSLFDKPCVSIQMIALNSKGSTSVSALFGEQPTSGADNQFPARTTSAQPAIYLVTPPSGARLAVLDRDRSQTTKVWDRFAPGRQRVSRNSRDYLLRDPKSSDRRKMVLSLTDIGRIYSGSFVI